MVLTGEVADTIRERIVEIVKRRDAFVVDANREIAAFNGAVNALTALVEEPKQMDAVAAK